MDMSLFRNYSRRYGLKTLQELYSESRKMRRQTRDESAVADDLKQYQDAERWPKTELGLPRDIQHAVKKRNRSDAFNLECINPFTFITVLTGLSGAGVVACLATLYRAGLWGKAEMRLEWLIPVIIFSAIFVSSLCCCSGFKAMVKSDLEQHIQVRSHCSFVVPERTRCRSTGLKM